MPSIHKEVNFINSIFLLCLIFRKKRLAEQRLREQRDRRLTGQSRTIVSLSHPIVDFSEGQEGQGVEEGEGEGGKRKAKNPGNSFRRFVISCLIERRERENLGLKIEGGRWKREITLWPPKAAEKNQHWFD